MLESNHNSRNPNMTRGILYITGCDSPYYDQAVRSAESAKSIMPNLPIAIVTDHKNPTSIFDNVIYTTEMSHSFRDKPEFMHKTPFDQTLFVDTDTYFAKTIEDLWDILDYYSVAAAHTAHRRYDDIGSPSHIPEYNTGVILYKSTSNVQSFLKTWKEKCGKLNEDKRNQSGTIVDQPSFRYALFEHGIEGNDIKFFTLPPEYNVLTNSPGFVRGPAKILHGQHKSITLNKIADKLNYHTTTPGWDKRVYFPPLWPRRNIKVWADCPDSDSRFAKFSYAVRKKGPINILKRVGAKILHQMPFK